MLNYKKYIDKDKGDITLIFSDAVIFNRVVNDLSNLLSHTDYDKILGIEARGFILGGAVSFNSHKAFVPVRKKGGLSGPTVQRTFVDYTRKQKTLEIKLDAIKPNDKVIIIDDWIETGTQVKTCVSMVEELGGKVVSILTIVDETSEIIKKGLSKYNYRYLVSYTA